MKKQDLKTGMLIQYRDGEYRKVMRDTIYGDILSGNDGQGCLSDYNDDMNCCEHYELDIIKVFNPLNDMLVLSTRVSDHALIFDRDKPTEMTIKEIEEKLGITNLKIKK